MANASSAITDGILAVAEQYNDLRTDAIGPYGDERVWPDNIAAKFGTGEDVSITFNGTNLQTVLAAPASFLWGDTANANMTQGITINQGATDDQILAFKSSDVAHGMTTLAETDTYAGFSKVTPTEGGLNINGYSEAHRAIQINARAATEVTTKSTSGLGAYGIVAQLKTGTTVTDMGTDANLFYLANNGTTRFIYDAEGSAHADVEWTTYDTYDDLAVIESMEAELLAGLDDRQIERRKLLARAGIVAPESWHMENGRPRAMVDFTKLAMLHHGALIQANARIKALESRLALTEGN